MMMFKLNDVTDVGYDTCTHATLSIINTLFKRYLRFWYNSVRNLL